jgi:YD repeat-containing protein
MILVNTANAMPEAEAYAKCEADAIRIGNSRVPPDHTLKCEVYHVYPSDSSCSQGIIRSYVIWLTTVWTKYDIQCDYHRACYATKDQANEACNNSGFEGWGNVCKDLACGDPLCTWEKIGGTNVCLWDRFGAGCPAGTQEDLITGECLSTCPDGVTSLPAEGLSGCPKCPDGITNLTEAGVSACPLCPDGITYLTAGGIPSCPCISPYTKESVTNDCVTYCPPESNGVNLNLGKCNPIAEQSEPPKTCAGNPIDIETGEKIQYETPDYESQGLLPLVFSRNYQSKRAAESGYWLEEGQITPISISVSQAGWIRYVQPVGYQGAPYAAAVLPWEENPADGTLLPPVSGQKQWLHNYQISLLNTGEELIRTDVQGELRFSNTGNGVYRSLQVTPEQIVTTSLSDGSTGFIYQKSPRIKEYYTTAGQLLRIEQSATVYQDLSYNSEGQLIQVTHSLGGALQLSYNPLGQLSQLLSPENTTVTYLYDAYGNLIQVTKAFADGQSTNRTYHYENANLPYALTGITDEAGIRYATWSYNTQGQAISSSHAQGADATTLSYQGETATTVTNALGKSTTYHYQTLGDVKRLTSVEGVASANCAGANKAYGYYANGLLKSKTDWQGNTTTYTYNSKHQQITRTEAAGTTQERTITTVWHNTLDVPIQVTTPSQIIEYSYDTQGNVLSKTVTPVNTAQGVQ